MIHVWGLIYTYSGTVPLVTDVGTRKNVIHKKIMIRQGHRRTF